MKRRLSDPICSPAALRAAAVLAVAVSAAACTSQASPGTGMPANAFKAAPSVAAPLDAIPSPDGSALYFIAEGDKGAAVYSLSKGAMRQLSVGSALAAPLGIATATDGKTLFVSDLAGGDDDLGAIYALDNTGGAMNLVAGSAGSAPRGLAVVHAASGDQIYFTGADSDGAPAVFKISAAGGAASVVYKGAGLFDPTGITVDHSGTIYVMDATQDGSRLVRISGGAATELVGGLQSGYPAGIALAQNEQALIFADADATGGYELRRMPLSAGPNGATALAIASLGQVDDPAGIHRAAAADVYAFVDSGAGAAGNVWLLSK